MFRMCLVALAWNCHPRWRLVLAGNRDEYHQRPALPLAAWRPGREHAEVVAGRDLQSGGTWLGVDRQGRCAVVTNYRAPETPSPGGTSRGSLPLAFLTGTAGVLEHGEAVLQQLGLHAPFNLLLVDATHCLHVGNHPHPTRRRLTPGIHGISNGGLDRPWPKTRKLGAALESWRDSGAEDLDPLWQALADEVPSTDAELPDTGIGLELERLLATAFIRGRAYGTRASTLVRVDHAGQGWISERRFGPDGVFEGETTLCIGR